MFDFETDFTIDYNANDFLEGNQVDTVSSIFAAPTSQTDFNSGGSWDPLKVLTAGAAVVRSVAGSIAQIASIPGQVKVQSAVAEQGNALAMQSLATQGALAKIQDATKIAEATAAYKRAAGITDSSWILILTAAAVGLAAVALFMRKG
jgi:hypothetical protein